MAMSKWFKKRLAWLTLCTIVFGTFAPYLSKLLATSQGQTWIEVCSSQGSKLVALDLGKKSSSDMPTTADNHCGYCLLQQNSPFVLNTFTTLDLAAVATGRLSIGPGGSTVFTRFVRNAHPPRAPPTFSLV